MESLSLGGLLAEMIGREVGSGVDPEDGSRASAGHETSAQPGSTVCLLNQGPAKTGTASLLVLDLSPSGQPLAHGVYQAQL